MLVKQQNTEELYLRSYQQMYAHSMDWFNAFFKAWGYLFFLLNGFHTRSSAQLVQTKERIDTLLSFKFRPFLLRHRQPKQKNFRGINVKSYSRTDNVCVGQYEINSVVHPGVSLHNSRSGLEPMNRRACCRVIWCGNACRLYPFQLKTNGRR